MFTASNGYATVTAATKAAAVKKLNAIAAKAHEAEKRAADRAAAAGFYAIFKFVLCGSDGESRLVAAGNPDLQHFVGDTDGHQTVLKRVLGSDGRDVTYEHQGYELLGVIVDFHGTLIGTVERSIAFPNDRPRAIVLAAEPFRDGAVYSRHLLPVVPPELFRAKDGKTAALVLPNAGRAIESVVRSAVERAAAARANDELAEAYLAGKGQ